MLYKLKALQPILFTSTNFGQHWLKEIKRVIYLLYEMGNGKWRKWEGRRSRWFILATQTEAFVTAPLGDVSKNRWKSLNSLTKWRRAPRGSCMARHELLLTYWCNLMPHVAQHLDTTTMLIWLSSVYVSNVCIKWVPWLPLHSLWKQQVKCCMPHRGCKLISV